MTNHGTILLVENDQNDVLLMKKAFVEEVMPSDLQVVDSYADVVKYLSGDGVYANRVSFPMPFLMILDLKIPGEGGFAVLRWLHDRPGLRKKFIVIVLSTAALEQEIQLAYELGAQSFLEKPLGFKQFAQTVRRIKEYWIELNLLPHSLVGLTAL
ncbi:MAG TPA: response regulator [Verrucomicrobiae bacterium]|nr:response regulator [Verrucomicrobiae bacterium]